MHLFLQDLETKLGRINANLQMEEPIRVHQCLQQCNESIEVLKSYVKQYVFGTRVEEILYFKVFKPRFWAYLLYYGWLNDRHASANVDSPKWRQHLRKIGDWQVGAHAEFYAYYINDGSRRDGFYFTTRLCSEKAAFGEEDTGYDFLVAQILAEEWLRAYARNHNITYA